MAPLNEESVQEVATEEQEVELTLEQKTAHLAKLMADGKRELRAGTFEKAGELFGEAAEFAALHYGELAAQSFEPNFMYGRALVELSVIENDLFNNALVNMTKKGEEETEDKDGDESMTEEEREDVREMVADALSENAEELEKKETEEESKEDNTEEKAKGDEADGESKDETKEQKAEKESTDEATAAGDNKEGEEETEAAGETEEEEAMEEGDAEKEDIEDGDAEDEEEEELDNNQLAWEALEVASKIADKMIAEEEDKSEWKRKKADVFIQLAQCSANNEKYESALEDLARARELIAEVETKKGDRLIAEIYFHEGRVNRLRSEFILAEESFLKAAGALGSVLEEVKADAGDSPTDTQKEDMADLESIIKDFKDRAEDCKGSDAQKKLMAALVEKEKAENPSILTSSNANSDPTANDISGLVRKRKVNDESEMEGATKRDKSEAAEEKGEENVAV